MKRRKKAALFDPYLDTLGGGEKHILSIFKVLEENGYELNIVWDDILTSQIRTTLHIGFDHPPLYLPNVFTGNASQLQKAMFLKNFDIFFYVTDGSYFFSTAGRSFVFAMVPDRKLYNMDIMNRLKTLNYRFVSNSPYTAYWLQKWGIRSRTITPYIDDVFLSKNPLELKKKKEILVVGRFFKHLHNKRHDLAIEAFKILKQRVRRFRDYRLLLAGGVSPADRSYFESLKKEAGADPDVVFYPDVPFDELLQLYRGAEYFWHMAGYGIDAVNNPHLVEHFGIAPLEAMATGAVPFCYGVGGPTFFIDEGVNGFLFRSIDELVAKMQSDFDRKKVVGDGHRFVKESYSYASFKSQVEKSILEQP